MDGNRMDDNLKVLSGTQYASARFADPGVYEIKVQAKDGDDILSDIYYEPIYIYDIPQFEVLEVKEEDTQLGYSISSIHRILITRETFLQVHYKRFIGR
jgi:hypothetical protein